MSSVVLQLWHLGTCTGQAVDTTYVASALLQHVGIAKVASALLRHVGIVKQCQDVNATASQHKLGVSDRFVKLRAASDHVKALL